MSQVLQAAVELAAAVYEAFMHDVIETHVLEDRAGGELDKKKAAACKTGRIIDTRVVRLMAISGKGGYSPDATLRKHYETSTNVTLLDHLLSVVRSALAFAALDILGSNPDADRDALRRQLRVLAALAFMHDLDKDLQLRRDAALQLDLVAERWARYGLDDFVGEDDAVMPDQVRYLIEQAEATQAHRSPPSIYPPRRIEQLMTYVALADKLDGLWLKDGIDAVLERLSTDHSLSMDLLRDWAVVDLFDPHHPFLIDELQRAISSKCWPLPPLIEVHQDGRLLMLIPAARAEEIKERAIKAVCSFLSCKLFGMRINISNRGTPEILDAAPSHDRLLDFMASTDLPDRELGRLFLVKASLANKDITTQLDALLGEVGLGPSWPKASGQTLTPYPAPERLSEDAQRLLRQAGHLVLLLSHKQVKELPDYAQREQALIETVAEERPAWISEIEDATSRRAMTALWAMRLAVEDAALEARLWGAGGLLQQWLEGTEGRRGLRDTIESDGDDIIEAVARHFRERLSAASTCQAHDGTKRCIFTDIPVAKSATFASADQLYELKKSAFSGRDGRLEAIDATLGETHISPVSYVEHRFRGFVHASVKGKPDGIPTLLSSPSTTGLFAALALNNERSFSTLSVYDLAREDTKGVVYQGLDVYRHRYRVARFERLQDRIEDQVDQLRLLLRAALRIGRPIHLFRGLPTPEKAFFAFDAMPRRLADLIGGNRLRIEQLPDALRQLETAQLILNTNGLGFEVFDRYTRRDTRLGAICLSWAQLHDATKDGQPDRGARFRREFEQLLKENAMSKTNAPLVELGRAATRIQQRPYWNASANEELLTFNLSLSTAIASWKLGQRDAESLTMAIAGELDTNLVRKQKEAARQLRDDASLTDECLTFARRFVNDVWFDVLNGRPPAQGNRKILASIYRMAFLTATRPKADAETAATTSVNN